MKIKAIEIFLADIPLLFKKSTFHGKEDVLTQVLVRIDTDEGISGWGETGGKISFSGEEQEEIAVVLQKYLAPTLIGEDPFNRNLINFNLWKNFPGHNFAKAALDFALYDLIGKSLGQPVYNLLGGRIYKKLKVGWSLYLKNSLSELIEDALMAKEEGFQAVKLKVGSPDPSVDLQNLKELRHALGDDFTIRVDANEAYNFIEALNIFKKMEEFNIQLIEQPVHRRDIHSLAQLKQKLDTPIMVDESIFDCKDVLNIIENNAADILNIKPQRVGGLHEAVKIANIAAAANIPCFGSGKMSTSIGSTACAHFAFSIPNLIYEGEFALGVRAICNDLVVEPLAIKNGFVELGSLPGLGIEVNEKLVNKYSKNKFIIK